MNKILIVVDMQNDFIAGSLGTPEAEAIVPRVIEKVRSFDGAIFSTHDTHYDNYLETREGMYLPVAHCVKGTPGHDIERELAEVLLRRNAVPFRKETFGSVEMAEVLKNAHEKKSIDEIELCGLCTDICVISNALLLKAFLPEVKISVDASCCAGVTPEKHKAALGVMESCHIEVVRL